MLLAEPCTMAENSLPGVENRSQAAQIGDQESISAYNITTVLTWHEARKTTLDEWSEMDFFKTGELEKNDPVHGGSLILDRGHFLNRTDSRLSYDFLQRKIVGSSDVVEM